jgi:hypothetical protein
MQMWPDLFQKAKDGGLDVIQTYVFWNGHEPSPGNVINDICFYDKFFFNNFFTCFYSIIFHSSKFYIMLKIYSITSKIDLT